MPSSGAPILPSTAAHVPCPALDPHTGSDVSLSLAKSWLSHCASHHHPVCPRPAPVRLPTRVLFIPPSPSEEADPFLFTPPPTHPRSHYLALSHCWGSAAARPLTTTTATLAARERSIPLASLPPTFRDAVRAARALGYAYLWIDSLCILQDSAADWAAESARMGAYFADCDAVLAAADSRDSRGGLFRARDPRGHRPSTLVLALPGAGVATREEKGSSWRYYAWPAEETRAVVTTQLGWEVERLVGPSPLDDRAWTLQEQMLAARVLGFGRFQLQWACRVGDASDNKPGLVERVSGNEGLRWTRLLIAGGNIPEQMEKQELYLDWYRTVERYTARSITMQSDILPAIGGLASRFQPLVDDQYVAGLWEADLHHGMLWRVEGPIIPGEQRFRAPSWSWAAINLTSIDFREAAKVLEGRWQKDWFSIKSISVPLATSNPYGEVDGGELRVEGYMRELQLTGPSVAGKVYEYRKNVLLNPLTEEAVGDIFLDYPRLSTDPPLRVWCMPVVYFGYGSGAVATYCLALVAAGGAGEEDRFKRVGLANIITRQWDRDFFRVESGKRTVCLV